MLAQQTVLYLQNTFFLFTVNVDFVTYFYRWWKKQALFYHSVVYLLVNSFCFALIGKAVKLMKGGPYFGHIGSKVGRLTSLMESNHEPFSDCVNALTML